jgi:hypothetical protein
MADHVWFVPASGGGITLQRDPTAIPQVIYNSDSAYINVQWAFVEFPVILLPDPNPATVLPCCFSADVGVGFGLQADNGGTPVTAPDYLSQCFARFKWTSWATCPPNPRILQGGSLRVGTVFSRFLQVHNETTGDPTQDDPTAGNASTWSTVEAWVKFRVANKNRFSKATFGINGLTPVGTVVGQVGAAPHDWLVNAVSGGWRVAYARHSATWEDFSDKNLRAVLTVDGTTNPANVGESEVDVEWFAFRLSDQTA